MKILRLIILGSACLCGNMPSVYGAAESFPPQFQKTQVELTVRELLAHEPLIDQDIDQALDQIGILGTIDKGGEGSVLDLLFEKLMKMPVLSAIAEQAANQIIKRLQQKSNEARDKGLKETYHQRALASDARFVKKMKGGKETAEPAKVVAPEVQKETDFIDIEEPDRPSVVMPMGDIAHIAPVAEPVDGRSRSDSIDYVKPAPATISFAGPKNVRIMVYADNGDVGGRIKDHFWGGKGPDCVNALSQALNVTVARGETVVADVTVVLQAADFDRLMGEATGDPEYVIFAIGANATEHTLRYLHTLSRPNIVNSVVLFNPTLPRSRFSQLVPNYNFISNRVYNFWNKVERGGYRKIYPARNGEGAATDSDNNLYFKGVNIFPWKINQEGQRVDTLDFTEIQIREFLNIIKTMQKANSYRLQQDLDSLIINDTRIALAQETPRNILKSTADDLPIVVVRHSLQYHANQVGADNISTLVNKVTTKIKTLKSEYYNYSIPEYVKGPYGAAFKSDNALNDYLMSRWVCGIPAVQDFYMVKKNPYTPNGVKSNSAPLGDEAIDIVQTKIKTYRLEKEYIEKRRGLVAEALQELCESRDPVPPINIAIVASGGGSRAMFATYGALKGLLDIGVLNASSYVCGLSGSTWALSSLFTEVNGDRNQARNAAAVGLPALTAILRSDLNVSYRRAVEQAPRFGFITEAILRPVKRYIAKSSKLRITPTVAGACTAGGGAGMLLSSKQAGAIAAGSVFLFYGACRLGSWLLDEDTPAAIMVKLLLGQPVTNTDYYGAAIAKYLLGKGDLVTRAVYEPQYLTDHLGSQAKWKEKNMHLPANYKPCLPFPIYTAVADNGSFDNRSFPWFEFTPYQIGSVFGSGTEQTGMFVKTWAFGRKFNKGISIDYAPEQPLEFYLGVFGSAMNASLREAMGMASQGFKQTVDKLNAIPLSGFFNTNYRPSVGAVFNPMYAMDMKNKSTYCPKTETIGLIDAGLSFNLPFPPLNDYVKYKQTERERYLRSVSRRPERKPDIIIFIDASDDSAGDVNIVHGDQTKQAWANGAALRSVKEYAGAREIPFPLIPDDDLRQQTCQIFKQQDKKSPGQDPLVIYLPLTKIADELHDADLLKKVNEANTINNDVVPQALDTINMPIYSTGYTYMKPQDSVNLTALMHYNVLRNKDLIVREICDRVMLLRAMRR